MGWKRFKEHYRIGHYVRVEKEGICIGSGLCYNLIVVSMDGVITKRDSYRGNDDLNRYQKEIDADPELCRQLLAEPDVFSQSLPVWTFNGGDIIEKQCEEYGWPNCTHDGEMMYDNRHFKTREEAVEKAIEDAEAGVRIAMDRVREDTDRLNKSVAFMDRCRKDLNKLLGRNEDE